MIKKILPILLLLIGTGAGIGGGVMLRPPPEVATQTDAAETEKKAAAKPAKEEGSEKAEGFEYLEMSNQFVVPILRDKNVTAMVVLSLSLEVPTGVEQEVFKSEPKLRDSFLQVMFDHASFGGFSGNFTDATNLKPLRVALRESAQRDLGEDKINDVLIVEIARQDY